MITDSGHEASKTLEKKNAALALALALSLALVFVLKRGRWRAGAGACGAFLGPAAVWALPRAVLH